MTLTEFLVARALDVAVNAHHVPERAVQDVHDARATHDLVVEWRNANRSATAHDGPHARYLDGLRAAMVIQARRYRDHPDWDPTW